MASNTNPLENLGSNLNLFSNNSSEPKLASWPFMESTSNQLYPKFPNSVQFTSQGASQNLCIGHPIQFHDPLNPYQASSTDSYLKDWICSYASSPCESNDKSGFKHGCESMGLLNSPSNDSLKPPMYQPEITRTFNFQMLPSALANSRREVSCLGSVKNHKNATGRENKNNVQTKMKIDKGWWDKVTVRGQWSYEEDKLLMQLVKQHGAKWARIAEKFPLRIGKQCRDRWQNYLRPNIRKEVWSVEEDKLLIELHKQFGNKWSQIARRLPGRCENTIKNHWNATKRRQFSSKSHDKPKYHSLLKDYIMNVTSSSSDDQINIQEKPRVAGTTTAPPEQAESLDFDPQHHPSMMSFSSGVNAPSSSSSGSEPGDQPGGLVLNESDFEFDQVPSHLASQLEFDPKMEMDFLEMLYQ